MRDRGFSRLAIFICLSAWALLCSLPAIANQGNAQKYLKLGFDAEISSRSIAWLVPYFDLDHLEAKIEEKNLREQLFSQSFLDEIVWNGENLSMLPEEMRAQLVEGLDLTKTPMLTEQKVGLLGADGKPLHNEGHPTLIKPSATQPLTGGTATLQLSRPANLEAKPSLILPKGINEASTRSDWPLVQARWKRLPLAERQAAIKVSALNRQQVADLITSLPVPPKNKTALKDFLRLRKNAPAWMSKVDFSLDGSPGRRPLEIALAVPAENIEEGMAVIDQFAKETRLQNVLSAPHRQKRIDSTIHLHLGLKPETPEEIRRKLEPMLLEYKRLNAIRLLAAGEFNDDILFPRVNGQVTASHTPYEVFHRDTAMSQGKGLVRLVADDHIELRRSTAAPRATVSEFAELLSMEEDAAKEKIAAEVRQLMEKDPSIVRRIEDINPVILTDFVDVLGRDTVLRSAKKNIRTGSRLIWEMVKKDPSIENYQMLLDLAREFPHEERDWLGPYYLGHFKKNPKAVSYILSHIKNHPEDVPLKSYDLVMEWSNDPHDLRIDLLQKARTESERIEILRSLMMAYHEPSPKSPGVLAETNRLAEVLRQMYGQRMDYGPSWLLANRIMKWIRKTNLPHADAVALAKRSIWTRGVGEEAVAVLRGAGKIPEHLVDGYNGARMVVDNLEKGLYIDFLEVLATGEEQAINEEALRFLVQLNGSEPPGFLEFLRKQSKGASPALSKTAESTERMILAAKSLAVLGCQKNFSELAP